MDAHLSHLVEGVLEAFRTSNPAPGVFAADLFADLNVPEWRFQIQGREAVATWLKGELPDGATIVSHRADPTGVGFILEVEQRFDRDGESWSSRNLHRFEVRDGEVAEWTMYCTGDWSPEVQRRQSEQAPMIRP